MDSESKNSFTNQIESYDAYNIILDRNSKKNEEELNVMKKYDIMNDENLIQEDDDKEMRENIKEHFKNLNGSAKRSMEYNEKNSVLKSKNNSVRIRSGNNNIGPIKNLKIQTNNYNYEKKNETVDAEEFKNFLNSKKQKTVNQVSNDYSEHL